MSLTITKVQFWKVVVPCRPDTVNSPGIEDSLQRHDPSLPLFDRGHKWIIRLQASSGHTGVGETGRSESQVSVEACAKAVHGLNIRDLPWQRLPLPANEAAYAFEVALLDLVGKVLEVPVHQLLGGKCRERVAIDYWMGRCTVEDTARRAANAFEQGYRGIKIKCTLTDPIAERVAAIEEHLPGGGVVLDPNERFYNPAGAMQIDNELAEHRNIIFESPVPQDRLDWYVLLRQKLRVPIALHLLTARPLLEALRRDAADFYNLSMGSPTEFVWCARLCEVAGCPVWHGSRMELGILDMAHLHACAAAPGCTLPSDLIGNRHREDDLTVEPICVEEGMAMVPNTPGLGVELDMDAVERYRVR
ncbi:MAG TPA: enolase C-terminal domain-like protein [Bryobacteraceae bacterium]|nr:enolase C-terminal domain-like protein [Bryobacteraceae bacterium]